MSSLDQDGGSTAPTESCYIYYRAYLLGGLIDSKSAFNASYPFVGRIPARSVPPPHTAETLKRCIAHAEGFVDPEGHLTALYADSSQRIPLNRWSDVAVLTPRPGLDGSTPENPYAIVYDEDPSSDTAEDTKELVYHNDPQDYIYYHLYTRTGEDPSRVAFSQSQPAIGRILKTSIAPPRRALSVKCCIATAEKKPIYSCAEMYKDISGRDPLSDDKLFNLSQDDCFGATLEKPLVLVQPERRPGLHNRPLKMLVAHKAPKKSVKRGTKVVRVAHEGWLSVAGGKIVRTDGICQLRMPPGEDGSVNVYAAEYDGQTGWITICKFYVFEYSLFTVPSDTQLDSRNEIPRRVRTL
ncbi:hypothetical protein FB451DRAFT_454123 [Mycena latifolia]|nr:hypothetical protein FB451DRAFT_454123 [Mycena latifolia]